MIFDKDIKAIQWRKDGLAADVAGGIGHQWTNKNKLQPKFTKINSKCIAELNINHKIIKTFRKNRTKSLDSRARKVFLVLTAKAQSI